MNSPFDIGGYVPRPQNALLDVVLTFADASGHHVSVSSAALVAAFIDLDREGLIPELGEQWIKNFPDIDLVQSNLSSSNNLARYVELVRHPDAMCECCGSECHAQFKFKNSLYPIERWSIVTSIMAMVDQDYLPELPFEWYTSLGRNYERICQTGRIIHARSYAGFCDV